MQILQYNKQIKNKIIIIVHIYQYMYIIHTYIYIYISSHAVSSTTEKTNQN